MVPWTQLREPPLWGKCLTDLTSEFTHFNLVIRLSNVKQPALLFSAFSWSPAAPAVPGFPVLGPFKWSCAERRKLLISQQLSATEHHDSCWNRQQACPFPAGVVSLVSGEVKHIVHLIRWNSYSRLCHCGTTWPRSRWREQSHDFLGFRNWVRFLITCFGFWVSSTSPPFGP